MPPKKGKKFRNKLSLSDKIELLSYYNKTKCSFRKLAQHFNIGKTQAAQIIRKQNVLLELWLTDSNSLAGNGTRISAVGLQIDKMVHDWFLEMKSENMDVTGPMIQSKALEISKNFGWDFKASNGWLSKFVKRHKIKFKNVRQKKDEAQEEVNICEWFKNLAVMLPNYSADNIFSAVQTGLFFKAVPDDVYTLMNENCSDGGLSEKRFTILFCTNMTGSKEMPLVVTGSSFNETDDMKLPDVLLKSNSKTWLTKDMMISWLEQLDSRMQKENRNILMFFNHTLPYHNFELKNTKVIYFPPCLSSGNYPVNQSIVQNFKILYRLQMLKHLIMLKESDENNVPSDVTVSMSQALIWVDTAWKELSESVIQKCYEDLCFNTYVSVEKVGESDRAITLNDVSDILCAYDSFVSAVHYVSIDDNLITVEDQKTDEDSTQNFEENFILPHNNDEIREELNDELVADTEIIPSDSKDEMSIDDPEKYYFESLKTLEGLSQFYLSQNDVEGSKLVKQLIEHHENIINKKENS